jgi:hypothetical protein
VADDLSRRFERVEDRVAGIETREAARDVREAARDVKVEIATSALNRLSVLVGSAGLGILAAIVGFVLNGGGGS